VVKRLQAACQSPHSGRALAFRAIEGGQGAAEALACPFIEFPVMKKRSAGCSA
jgi:hypothetical protein